MKRTKNVAASDSTTATSAKSRGAEKGITLVTRSPRWPKTLQGLASITPEIRFLDFKIGLRLLTPEQRAQLFEYHRIRDERAEERSLERAS